MSEQHDDIPPHVLRHFAEVVWKDERPIQVTIKPRDAWVLVGVLQFAWRNPGLAQEQKDLIEQFARQFQAALGGDPLIEKYLERGWNMDYDQPRRNNEG